MSTHSIAVTAELQTYLAHVGYREPSVLRALREETQALGRPAAMQISPEQGQLMALLIRLTGARQIIEVGTFTGYSALACAAALPDDGRLIACDLSREWARIGQPHWERAGVAHKIDLRLGDGAETLRALLADGGRGQFDQIFIDADKPGYDTYYELGLELLRSGGLVLVDNTLWDGAVADASDQSPDTVAIRALNHKIAGDTRIDHVLIPIGDGLTAARKR